MIAGHPLSAWVGFVALILALLCIDLGVLTRGKERIPIKEALWRSLGFFCLAMGFAAGLYSLQDTQKATEFVTGYLIELSLSVDNIFVFVLIFRHFAVAPKQQHRILFWGILGALLMRGMMIGIGAVLLQKFEWIIFIFGGLLIMSGIKMLVVADSKPDIEKSRIIRFLQKYFRLSHFLLVLLLIEISDLIFAIDSIPAIFAITRDPFIVFTSNVFAILGLRSLYFALAGIIHRFHYLQYGLALVLVLIGSKMLLNGWFGEAVISTVQALLATATLLTISIALSLYNSRKN